MARVAQIQGAVRDCVEGQFDNTVRPFAAVVDYADFPRVAWNEWDSPNEILGNLIAKCTSCEDSKSDGVPLVALGQQYANHLNSYTLVAVPLFVIAATFMQRGGVAKALIEMASAWVGKTRGALGVVCVLATTVFAAISGSSVATALAIGAVLIPAMKQRGYPIAFASGTVGAGGTLGILIPPSL
ncbi:MAG TPA: TRAP transporter large permease subunit, partial [Paracoccaceae bacterium]|nr:TRAP transporter large permease subunit [Paracoccaceae bacterium]